MIWILLLLALGLACGAFWLRQGERWGSTAEDRVRAMPGDEYLLPFSGPHVVMTRAISVRELPERIWPWIAQLGRGAGWYSVDWLDNGRRTSARHVISWIPEPREGDATAIGYLRHIRRERSLAWWSDGAPFLGARSRLVSSFWIEQDEGNTRLISRMSADATGPTALPALLVFRIIDSIMARRQLMGLRDRIEHIGRNGEETPDPETGARDQYQTYEIIYANGERAGQSGKESAETWRRAAVADGVIEPSLPLSPR